MARKVKTDLSWTSLANVALVRCHVLKSNVLNLNKSEILEVINSIFC